MDNTNQTQSYAGLLHESQFPDGIIKPSFLAASPTQAAGDMYYVNASGIFARLAIGTASQLFTVSGGLPAWKTNTGWIIDANTWTYSSVDGATGIVTINADMTGLIQAGDRIKLTQTTDKYFIVTKTPTVSQGTTTLTFWGGTDYTLANAAITAAAYSPVKNPFGFNTDPTKWQVKTTDSTNANQTNPVAGTWYNLGTISIVIPIGTWNVDYQANASFNRAASGDIDQYATLSTANNTESDTGFTTRLYNATSTGMSGTLTRSQTITVAAKTTYYLNAKNVSGSSTQINFLGSAVHPTVIRAICAYL